MANSPTDVLTSVQNFVAAINKLQQALKAAATLESSATGVYTIRLTQVSS
jgi:hypothetical protein